MAHVALGVANSGTDGTTAQDFRLIAGALWQNAGIVSGLKVSGKSSMAYDVAAGVAVCTRGASDGKTLAYWPGGSVATTANSGGNPRIDSIYIIAHDLSHGDADNAVAVGVAKGAPAASPVAPSIPAGATLIATMNVPAGATTTAQATISANASPALPYGASMGVLLQQVNSETSGTGSSTWKTLCSGTIELPSRRLVRIDMLTTCKGVVKNVGTDTEGTMHVRLLIDNSYDAGMGYERILQTTYTSDLQTMYKALDAGPHVFALQGEDGTCGWKSAYGNSGNSYRWPGQVLTVVDVGVA